MSICREEEQKGKSWDTAFMIDSNRCLAWASSWGPGLRAEPTIYCVPNFSTQEHAMRLHHLKMAA